MYYIPLFDHSFRFIKVSIILLNQIDELENIYC